MEDIKGTEEANRLIQKKREAREKTADGTVEAIRSLLNGTGDSGWTHISPSPLYNVVALAAEILGVKPIPFHRVEDAFDGDFTVEDVARLSNIPCRPVVFDENLKKDLYGTYIVFDEETDEPGVLAQSRKGHVLYRQGHLPERVGTAVAKKIKRTAYALYEPLPNYEIQGKKVLRFFLKDTSCGDMKWFIFLGVLATAIGVLIPYISRAFYDVLLPIGNISMMVQSLLVVAGCILGAYVFSVASNTFLYRMMSRGEYRLKAALLDRVFRLPPEVYNAYDSSDLTARATELPDMFRDSSIQIIKAGFGLILSAFYVYLLFKIGVSITLVSLGSLAVVTFVLVVISIRQRKRAIFIKNCETESQTFLFHMIGGIGRLRTAGSENQALNSYMNAYAKPMKVRMQMERKQGLSHIIRMVTSTIIVLLLLFYAYQDDYSVGEYVEFTTLFAMLQTAVYYALDQVMSVSMQRPVYDRAKVLLQTIPEGGSSLLVPKPFVGRVVAEGVSFMYPGAEKPVLRDVSFEIKPGEYIGVVGPSGCGKSTLMKLLLGFVTPDEGKIYYDGLDMNVLVLPELRRRMGVVLQEGNLIAGSVAENVAITKPEATDEEILEVLDRVGMSEDIEQMPMGLQTIMSEMSETISGGQRQRILIARAILNGPRVMFMDEATSALDNQSQKAVTEALDELNMTRIVIAHRLSTIRSCDRIFVIEDGSITQEGTYDELMNQDGFFRKMAERQLV